MHGAPTVRIGGVVFHGNPAARDSGFVIPSGGLTGWEDGTSMRVEDTPRPRAHGSFATDAYQSARVVTVSGWAWAQSQAALTALGDQLTGLLADGEKGRLTVDSPDGRTLWTDVLLSGQTTFERRSPYAHTADYQVQFWADDPRRYGALRVFSGGANAYHRGNAPAFPLIRISSGAATYNVVSPGGTFRVSGAPAGGEHVIDMRTGRLTRNGVPVLGAVVRAETWAIPRGARWTHTITAGSGLSVEVHDTYV